MTIRMRYTIFAAVLILTVIAASSALASGRVVNGDKVTDDQYAGAFQSVVSIHTDRTMVQRGKRIDAWDAISFQCGGVLIAPTLVLTAAHCVPPSIPTEDATGLRVARPGISMTGQSRSAKTDVEAVFVHPSYRPSTNVFWGRDQIGFDGFHPGFGIGPYSASSAWDVAVLRLASPLDGVTPAKLVAPAEDAGAWGAGAGRTSGATIVGWGREASQFSGIRGAKVGVLHALGITIRSDRNCERSDQGLGLDAGAFGSESMLCAGTADGPGATLSSRTTCDGDNGSPLFGALPDGSLRVVGIASLISTSKPCRQWAVFARIAAVRDWIASVPATPGAAGDIGIPSEVTASPRGSDAIRVTWKAPSVGSVARYRVYREASGPPVFFGPRPTGLLLAAATSPEERAVTIDGIEPRRSGGSRRHVIRVEVESTTGARRLSPPITVAAPIDARPPRQPLRPSIRQNSKGRVTVTFAGATDNDCIGAYVLQANDGRWLSISAWTNGGCDEALLAYAGTSGPFGVVLDERGGRRTHTFQFGRLAAGTYRFRIAAIDRAGNRTFSPTRVATLGQDAVGRSFGGCSGSSSGFWCSTTPKRASIVLAASAGMPVDVVVG